LPTAGIRISVFKERESMSLNSCGPVPEAVLSPSKEGGQGDNSFRACPGTMGTSRGQVGTSHKPCLIELSPCFGIGEEKKRRISEPEKKDLSPRTGDKSKWARKPISDIRPPTLGIPHPNRKLAHREAALVDRANIMRRNCKPFIINRLERPFLRDERTRGNRRNFQKSSHFGSVFGLFRSFSRKKWPENVGLVPFTLELA
jgi:hypothetical protein